MPSWRRIFTSAEARIESLAGASPPDPEHWADPITGDPDPPYHCGNLLAHERHGWCSGTSDWPMPEPPPYAADDENLERPDDKAES